MSGFSKLLVANRGEIACRVIGAARELGYATVAVFSDADAEAPHVSLADEAVRIGPGPALSSYLSMETILEAARRTGADALHPGYGFLSENPAFADACVAAKLVFVGPPAEAIRAMGDKALAKSRMRDAGVPTVPGFWGSDALDALKAAANGVGYPLLVKATAGGGGRGIRIVRSPAELPEAIASARSESASAFGSACVMLERFVERGRHVEVQVFADAHGHVLHFGERDCTAQRRRQKVIEEAPSPIVGPELRTRLGDAAVAAARAVGYRGAGTVEFIVDQAGEPYFLEMNTRLQVEHPVTEYITGLDLVKLQLRVAAGEPLTMEQRDVTLQGHAIEARIYAEDPYQGFTPQTGRIQRFDAARALNLTDVRMDAGYACGSEVSPYYDAMLGKLIVRGDTRTDAIRRLRRALSELSVFGPRTNASFLRDILATPEFSQARMHTGSLDEWLEEGRALFQRPVAPTELWAVASAILVGAVAQDLRAASVADFTLSVACDGTVERVHVMVAKDALRLRVQDREHAVMLHHVDDAMVRVTCDGVQTSFALLREASAVHLLHCGSVFVFREESAIRSATTVRDDRRVKSPMAGTLARVLTGQGKDVAEGDVLFVVEAMKIEVRVHAARAGIVLAVHRALGDQVTADELLAELEDAPSAAPGVEKT
jgi:geranyl-CoA carboxylase alpha subunit